MHKRHLFMLAAAGLFLFCLAASSAQEASIQEKILLLRKASQRQRTTVAVEAFLTGTVLEAKIIVSMYSAKPRIYNAVIVGPGLGRLSAQEKQVLYSTADEEDLIFPTEDMLGRHLRLTKAIKEKKIEGTLSKELHRFRLPVNKIKRGKRYELWIYVESLQSSGHPEKFDFELENLPELLSE